MPSLGTVESLQPIDGGAAEPARRDLRPGPQASPPRRTPRTRRRRRRPRATAIRARPTRSRRGSLRDRAASTGRCCWRHAAAHDAAGRGLSSGRPSAAARPRRRRADAQGRQDARDAPAAANTPRTSHGRDGAKLQTCRRDRAAAAGTFAPASAADDARRAEAAVPRRRPKPAAPKRPRRAASNDAPARRAAPGAPLPLTRADRLPRRRQDHAAQPPAARIRRSPTPR